ncbi:MAG: thioredoxin domain-containing protein [Rhodospirillaceae bacterium]
MPRNRLDEETSPYLLQHADNPVHWYGWGPEALAAAAAADRPILLSVGYAACHWCHVMAHECFENEAIAGLMNERFVNVKVDREERPDIDTIYMNALHLLGQQGGWPLTMFLTPDGRPFWGGTYFPPESRYGRPGFPEVLAAISDYWTEKRDKALEAADALGAGLQKAWVPAEGGAEIASGGIPLAANDQAAVRIAQEFDPVNGGFGGAPKFPNPSIHELVWRGWRRTGEARLRDAVLLSLTRMSQGGIYDHLGGGFARYSTDSIWLVPHFEKMLYDNAQLVDLLTWAWQDTGNPLFAQRADETIEWCLRDMTAPRDAPDGQAGAFAATYDADSEGEEGRFYVWTADEIDRVLGDGEDAALFRTVYDVAPAGNWEGRTILNRIAHPDLLEPDREETLAACRARLLEVRNHRVWPGWDDKILADWNGLMIAAMANAACVFGKPRWLEAATGAFAFVRDRMQENGRLRHSWRNGILKHAATLDDYANMTRAAIALYEATGDDGYIATARKWVADADAHYWDSEGGGYFFTADDAEALIVRTKSAADNATPAGNSTMAAALSRLYYLTGDDAFRARAEAIIAAFAGDVQKNFFPLTGLFCANEILQSCAQIVIVGDPADPVTAALRKAAWVAPGMNKLIQQIAPGMALPASHPAQGKGLADGRATAYVCVGQTCSLPLRDPAALLEAL